MPCPQLPRISQLPPFSRLSRACLGNPARTTRAVTLGLLVSLLLCGSWLQERTSPATDEASFRKQGISWTDAAWAAEPPQPVDHATVEFSPDQLEFFEKQVRPLLVEQCQKCHGAEKQEGGLRLDSRSAVLRGGDTGPALKPGNPDDSELILAIQYDPDGYQMPPNGKLSAEAIAVLTRWVQEGAPWSPEGELADMREAGLALTRDHWSLRPLEMPQVPVELSQPAWPHSAIDAFILQRLDQAGLPPSPLADRETLLRRASFDLLGLPPSPELRARFLADESPEAFARLVDELLESPHYGERWGRHWLDLVRYAETLGHEFDYDIQLAWKYRDYVIRAFNEDLPLDAFVREHLAGDLLPEPRLQPETGLNESILGTGFFWFGQGKHSPVDIRAEQCDLIENQLDVLSKTFLATSVACARCHDHKFDPVTIRDYYALSGILESSRRHYADLRPQAPLHAAIQQIHDLKQKHREELWETIETQLAEWLRGWGTAEEPIPHDHPQAEHPEHPAHPWKVLRESAQPEAFAQQKTKLLASLAARKKASQTYRQRSSAFADFSNGVPEGWTVAGQAFETVGPHPEFVCGTDPWKPVAAIVPPGRAHSGLASGRAAGVLRSPTFVISQPVIDYHLCRQPGKPFPGGVKRGPLKKGQAHLVIDGFQHIRSPIYGGLSFEIPLADHPVWHRQNVEKWIGHRAYIEIIDEDDGYLQLDQIRFSDHTPPVDAPLPALQELLSREEVNSVESLRQAYRTLFTWALAGLQEIAPNTSAAQRETADVADSADNAFGPPIAMEQEEQIVLLNEMLARVRRTERPMPAPAWLDAFYVEWKSLAGTLGTPVLGLTTTEGSPLNSLFLVRGNPGKPADEVPRRYLEVLGGTEQSIPANQSGRLELAHWIVSEENPLFDRVMVNRVWRYHFGEGLVASPDDFGKMGREPSHPELLDYLALGFRRQGRSMKWLHRQLMNTATYQMASDFRPDAQDADPQNRLWHRMPVRRLEGEAIRDSLLALSGRLRPELFGESILPHLTPFMQGRGRPGASGPLDGEGRRSIYLSVRRNFLSPLFLAFDYPLPLTTTGRRSVSNVPAQALTLMNSDFTVQQTRQWADRLLRLQAEHSDEERIRQLYREAFTRDPTPAELQAALHFLSEERAQQRSEFELWSDLCHVLVNVKEFTFIR